MEPLSTHIAARLEFKKFCVVFGNDLNRVFPQPTIEDEKRNAAIRLYAEQRGWDVTITDPGIRATFRPKV